MTMKLSRVRFLRPRFSLKSTTPQIAAITPGTPTIIGNATTKDRTLFALNHATCAMPHMTPE